MKIEHLRVHGVLGVVPERRLVPVVLSPVLRGPESLYVPPVTFSRGELVGWSAAIPVEEFDEMVGRDEASRVPEVEVQADGVVFFQAGDGVPEYVSLAHAASRLARFAEEKVRDGDDLMRRGLDQEALLRYELAAAAAQGPREYARMLLVEMAGRRRARIEEALEAVATLDPASRHVDDARAEVFDNGEVVA